MCSYLFSNRGHLEEGMESEPSKDQLGKGKGPIQELLSSDIEGLIEEMESEKKTDKRFKNVINGSCHGFVISVLKSDDDY